MRAKLGELPLGSFTGTAAGKRYVVSKTVVSAGRGWKLIAEALDRIDFISANIYDLTAGPILKPCEMPAARVIAFLAALEPDQ